MLDSFLTYTARQFDAGPKLPLTNWQKKLALVVAVIADTADVVMAALAASFPVILPVLPFIYGVIDIVAAVVLVFILGPEMWLLPTFIVEGIPVLNLVPTWTIATWRIISQRATKEYMYHDEPLEELPQIEIRRNSSGGLSVYSPIRIASIYRSRRIALKINMIVTVIFLVYSFSYFRKLAGTNKQTEITNQNLAESEKRFNIASEKFNRESNRYQRYDALLSALSKQSQVKDEGGTPDPAQEQLVLSEIDVRLGVGVREGRKLLEDYHDALAAKHTFNDDDAMQCKILQRLSGYTVPERMKEDQEFLLRNMQGENPC